MSTLIADLIPEVADDLSGVPDPAAERAIRHAAIDLCERASVWRLDHADVPLVDGVGSYTLTAPVGARIAAILRASAGSIPLVLAPVKSSTAIGSPIYAWLDPSAEGRLMISPAPMASAGPLRVEVALSPTIAADELPDFMVYRYLSALRYGARAKLMAMQRQTWSDPQGAQIEAAAFDAEVSVAHTAILRGNSYGSLGAKPRAFR